MTVCIAAISDFKDKPVIVGASDRMLTASDIQFEPEQPKINPITSSIVIMIAGDSATQAEIIHDVEIEIASHIAANPSKWIDLRTVAEVYVQFYNKRRMREVQNRILVPLGLDLNTFISRQNEMNSTFISQVATELYGYRIPDVEAIITGLDTTGAHIYVVSNGNITCNDTVGFASIGIGSGHANSQFMFAGHTGKKPYPDTLLLAYSAKKRAEVAPGVGEATDMFFIGTGLGTFTRMPPSSLGNLNGIYEKVRKSTQKNVDKSRGEIREWFNKAVEARDAERAKSKDQATAQDDSDASSTDSEAIRDDAETKNGGEDGKQRQ